MQNLKPGEPAMVLLEMKTEGDQSQQEMNYFRKSGLFVWLGLICFADRGTWSGNIRW